MSPNMDLFVLCMMVIKYTNNINESRRENQNAKFYVNANLKLLRKCLKSNLTQEERETIYGLIKDLLINSKDEEKIKISSVQMYNSLLKQEATENIKLVFKYEFLLIND